MNINVIMPKLTHDMQHGILLEWFKSEGETVHIGDLLFAVETDKASVQVEAEASGILHDLCCKQGEEANIGETIAYILTTDEAQNDGVSAKLPSPEPSVPVDQVPIVQTGKQNKSSKVKTVNRVIASPIAKRMAAEFGLDLRQIQGHGPSNRIIKTDIESFISKQLAGSNKAQTTESVSKTIELSRLQEITGKRMLSSITSIPHYDLEVDVDMSEVNRWRNQINDSAGIKISYTAFFIKTSASSLKEYPFMNASYDDGKIKIIQNINIGVAINTDQGLVVPVLQDADQMGLRSIQESITQLREKAKSLNFRPTDIGGSTFTISNLGMYGVDAFRAIINPPEAAILAIGKIIERPVGIDSQIVLRPMVRLILSVDHRIIDGSLAGMFLSTLRSYVENPCLILT